MFTSYKREWVEKAHAHRDGLLSVLELSDPFRHWDKVDLPCATLSNDLSTTLGLIYAGTEPAVAQLFIDRVSSVVDRTIQDGKVDVLAERTGEELSIGEFFQLAAYVRIFSTQSLDKSYLRQSNAYLSKWVLDKPKRRWHKLDHSLLLEIVFNHFLLDEVSAAKEWLSLIPKNGWLQTEGPLLDDLADTLLSDQEITESLRHRLVKHFDLVRDPDYKPERVYNLTLLRLEVGALVWKYLYHPGEELRWDEIIEMVAA